MSFAHKDSDHQLAQAVTVVSGLTQVMIIARSQALLDMLSQEMASDANVQGKTLRADFHHVVNSDRQNWDLINYLVFEVSQDMEADLNAVRKLRGAHGNTLQFIAVSAGPMTDAVKTQYASAGIVEVLVLDAACADSDVVPVTEPVPSQQEIAAPVAEGAPDAGGDVTVVLRARGGAGATTVAVNLAIDLAVTSGSGRIALVDLDLQNGSIGLALDLPDSAEMTALIQADMPQIATFLDRAMVRHSSGVDVLTAPNIFAPLSAMTPDMVTSLIRELKVRYDHIILDLSQAVVDWTSPVLADATRALIVSDMSVPSVIRVRRLIDLISEEHMTLPIRTIINFEKRPKMPSQVHKEAARLIGRPLEHWIPNDPRAARRAVDMGVPLRLGAKRSGASKAISALGKSLFTQPKKG
ncbi:AAA family ATPase [Roseovarius arcticus]|uniref:AAA family ATPase n=1 Tax=Roseovarius arcticus TaxID=2547404 RepID=UPI0011109DE5|nr:AAA family ATPase [Roseovarius arcticus]